jgi:hypothetical protein
LATMPSTVHHVAQADPANDGIERFVWRYGRDPQDGAMCDGCRVSIKAKWRAHTEMPEAGARPAEHGLSMSIRVSTRRYLHEPGLLRPLAPVCTPAANRPQNTHGHELSFTPDETDPAPAGYSAVPGAEGRHRAGPGSVRPHAGIMLSRERSRTRPIQTPGTCSRPRYPDGPAPSARKGSQAKLRSTLPWHAVPKPTTNGNTGTAAPSGAPSRSPRWPEAWLSPMRPKPSRSPAAAR